MHKRDDTFSKCVEFKALVEKEMRKKVRDPRRDIGCEYVSNEFKFFYVKEVIR